VSNGKTTVVHTCSLCALKALLFAKCTLEDGDVEEIHIVIAIEDTDAARLATHGNARAAQAIDDFAPIVEAYDTVQICVPEQLACIDEQITVAVVAAG
jgi:hypothetical protein